VLYLGLSTLFLSLLCTDIYYGILYKTITSPKTKLGKDPVFLSLVAFNLVMVIVIVVLWAVFGNACPWNSTYDFKTKRCVGPAPTAPPDTLPVGIILPYVGESTTTPPEGFLFCDGSLVDSKYTQLLQVLSPSINTPNLQGRMVFHYDTKDPLWNQDLTLGTPFGDLAMPSHSHPVNNGMLNIQTAGVSQTIKNLHIFSAADSSHTTSGCQGCGFDASGKPNTTCSSACVDDYPSRLPPSVVVTYIIKADPTVANIPVGTLVPNLSNTTTVQWTIQTDFANHFMVGQGNNGVFSVNNAVGTTVGNNAVPNHAHTAVNKGAGDCHCESGSGNPSCYWTTGWTSLTGTQTNQPFTDSSSAAPMTEIYPPFFAVCQYLQSNATQTALLPFSMAFWGGNASQLADVQSYGFLSLDDFYGTKTGARTPLPMGNNDPKRLATGGSLVMPPHQHSLAPGDFPSPAGLHNTWKGSSCSGITSRSQGSTSTEGVQDLTVYPPAMALIGLVYKPTITA
jgi:hypothetical protein